MTASWRHPGNVTLAAVTLLGILTLSACKEDSESGTAPVTPPDNPPDDGGGGNPSFGSVGF